MRIIAGNYRGRRLAGVPAGVRPTSDRLRESLFNVLGDAVEGTVWADLFAGTGAVGIEALSRGARFVLFNERDFRACRVLQKNLELCGVPRDAYRVLRGDALKLASSLPLEAPADVIFLDPPYAFGAYRSLLERLAGARAVNEETLVILELFKKKDLDFLGEGWEVERRLAAGDSVLHFLRRRAPR
ncbi:MAG: 16S rRNA (guanine(966)-N(2))-methyltransferase RsmD [Acidobacteriota bacterium]